MYDLDENNGNNFDGSLRAVSELPVTVVRFSNAWLVGDGTSVIGCCHADARHIAHSGPITRGWDARRREENGRRVHYLRRRQQIPEEGYYSCALQGDTNSPRGVYILYPSEWPSLMIYSGTSEERTLLERHFCPLFGGCPLLGGCLIFALYISPLE